MAISANQLLFPAARPVGQSRLSRRPPRGANLDGPDMVRRAMRQRAASAALGCYSRACERQVTRNTRNGTRNGYRDGMASRSTRVRRICPECQRSAQVDLRATYCSPACRQAAYRRRLRQGEPRALSVMSHCAGVTDVPSAARMPAPRLNDTWIRTRTASNSPQSGAKRTASP